MQALTQDWRTPTKRNFGQFLLDNGSISAAELLAAKGELVQCDTTLSAALIAGNFLSPQAVLAQRSRWCGLPKIGADRLNPDPQLRARIDPGWCLTHASLPLRVRNGRLVIAISRPSPDGAVPVPAWAEGLHLEILLATEQDIQAALMRFFRPEMTRLAANRVAELESCRRWERQKRGRIAITAIGLLTILLLTLVFPKPIFIGLGLYACLSMLVAMGLKFAATLAFLLPAKVPPQHKQLRRRPKVSVLVPLFHEPEVAHVLLRRLQRIRYPKSLLDVVLVLEERDAVTREALQGVELPFWVRVITVPDGEPRTKPRALNYALDLCFGDIIGVYDAEDAPEPDQIDKVAARFMTAPKEVACLQGVLDYYNAGQNWLSRCFTIEYATWFRVLMPGMARLGFALPLGGTTLFIRRDVLQQLGGWDAHNVTEDADLGFRLSRYGYRTEMLNSTTYEEANCRPLPWIKQRSRWLKGYMATYLVHMRHPRVLLQQLGLWRFLGFQLHFITALSQFLLAPLLWSFWLIPFGLPHPLGTVVPSSLLVALAALFFGAELMMIFAGLIAVAAPRRRHLLAWVPSMHFYYFWGVFAAHKALFELVVQPFYWDKTTHGLSLQHQTSEVAAIGR